MWIFEALEVKKQCKSGKQKIIPIAQVKGKTVPKDQIAKNMKVRYICQHKPNLLQRTENG